MLQFAEQFSEEQIVVTQSRQLTLVAYFSFIWFNYAEANLYFRLLNTYLENPDFSQGKFHKYSDLSVDKFRLQNWLLREHFTKQKIALKHTNLRKKHSRKNIGNYIAPRKIEEIKRDRMKF
ncbi:MAG: hypothetical protein JWR61_2276 [Ferruginibacter sp.]|nr:hypothetical protein [Ferruginibacter sp.]